MLTGNKCDLQHLRSVSTQDAEIYAAKEGIFSKWFNFQFTLQYFVDLLFLETSALNSVNIDTAFQKVLSVIHEVKKFHFRIFNFLLSILTTAITNSRTNTAEADFGKFGWNWEVESCSERKMLQLILALFLITLLWFLFLSCKSMNKVSTKATIVFITNEELVNIL